MNTCPYCGSEMTAYLGMDDGGGDYGEAVCEQFKCYDCGQHFEGDCIGQAIDGAIGEDGIQEYFIGDNEAEDPIYYDQRDVDDLGEIPW